MILTQLNLTKEETSKRKTMLVPVPQWGEDAEIMVTEITVAGYVRRNTLQHKVLGMEGLTDNRRTALIMCCQLLSTMIHPETGDFLLPESDLEKFEAQVNETSLQALLLADAALNPQKEFATLDTKKKNS